jgi:hypothetical protein
VLTVDQADQVSVEKWAATVPKVLLVCQVLQVNQAWTVKLADEVFPVTLVKMVQLVNQVPTQLVPQATPVNQVLEVFLVFQVPKALTVFQVLLVTRVNQVPETLPVTLVHPVLPVDQVELVNPVQKVHQVLQVKSFYQAAK